MRAINTILFGLSLILLAPYLALKFKADAVVASSTHNLDAPGCWLLSRLSNARFVYEVHDLWPLSIIELGGMSRKHPFVQLVQWCEDLLAKRTDRVLSILPFADRHLATRGMDPAKYRHVPNGIDPGEWSDAEVGPELDDHLTHLRETKASGQFLIGYLGSHGIANNLELLLEAASATQEVQFVLIGDGPLKPELEARAETLRLSNVSFLPPVKKKAVPVILKEFDALYVGLQACEVFRFGISPNKVFDYMAAGKPIIMAIDTPNDFTADADCGVTIRDYQPQSLASQIKRVSTTEPEQMAVWGKNAKQYVDTHHTYPVLARAFCEYLTD